MPTKRTRHDPPAALSAEDELLLRYGPATAPLPSPATHDRLRRLWAVHAATIVATMPHGERPWFVDRDVFVRMVRGEDR